MTQLNAYRMADTKWFSRQLNDGSEDPYGGSAPLWLEDGVATYTPPSQRTTLAGDFLNRSLYWANTGRFFSTLTWGKKLSNALGWTPDFASDNQGKANVLSESFGYDPTKDYESIPESTRNILAGRGWTLDAVKKSVRNPDEFVNEMRDVMEVTELDQSIKDSDANSTFVGYGAMKLVSAAVNVIGADPLNIALPGSSFVLKAGGYTAQATALSMMAGGAAIGSMNALDGFDTDTRWQIEHGLLDWEDVGALDYLGAAGVGAAIGMAFGAIPALLHFKAHGWTGKAGQNVAKAAAGQSLMSEGEIMAAVRGDYHVTKLAAIEALKDRFGDSWRQFGRSVVSPQVLGMDETAHASFLRNLITKLDNSKPTEAEFVEWLDPGFVRSNMDLDGAQFRMFRDTATDRTLVESPNYQIRRTLETRFSKSAEKYNFLTDPEATKAMGFEDQAHVAEWLKNADGNDIRRSLKYRNPTARQQAISGEYMADFAEWRSKVRESIPDIAEAGRVYTKAREPVGPVSNIVAPKAVERIDTLNRAAYELERSISNYQRVINSDSLLDKTGLRSVVKQKQSKLSKVRKELSKFEAKATAEAEAITGKPNRSPSLARQADAIRSKLASETDPNKIRGMLSRLKGISLRQKFAPDDLAAPYQSRSAVSVTTKFENLKTKLTQFRQQATALAAEELTPTQRTFLNDLNAEIESIKKTLRKTYRTDPDTLEALSTRATERASGGVPSQEATTPPPEVSDRLEAFLDGLERSDEYAVHKGMSIINDIGNLPVAWVLFGWARRALTARTGQERTIFNKNFEEIRWLSQWVDNTHTVNLDTKRPDVGRRSAWLVKHGVASEHQRIVVTAIHKLAERLNKPIEDIKTHINAHIRSGTLSGNPEIDAVSRRIRSWIDKTGADGVKYGVLSKLRDAYVPVVHNLQALRAKGGAARFVEVLSKKMTERWLKTTEINRIVAKELGWLKEVDDGLEITDAGRAVGFTDSMPERTALSPDAQAAYSKQVPVTMQRLARESRDKMMGEEFITLDEFNEPKVVDASKRQTATRQRMFSDDILESPEMQEFLHQDIETILNHYSQSTGLRSALAKELHKTLGLAEDQTIRFEDLFKTVKARVVDRASKTNDVKIIREASEAFDTIANKYLAVLGGRPNAQTNSTIAPALAEIGLNISRTAYGPRWGLYTATQELMGQVFHHLNIREFGQSQANMLAALKTSTTDTVEALADLGYANEHLHLSTRHSMLPGNEFGQTSFSYWDRIGQPWAEARDVATGRVTPGNTSGSTVVDGLRSVTGAMATTAVESGMVRSLTSVARIMRAKNMQHRLVGSLKQIDQLINKIETVDFNSMGPRERVVTWHRLAREVGLNPNDVIAWNARGILDRGFVDSFSDAVKTGKLEGRGGRWGLHDIKHSSPEASAKWLDEYEHRLQDYLVEAVDEQIVNPRPFLRNTDSATFVDMLINEMQTYARSFGGGLAYRAPNQMTIGKSLTVFLAFASMEGLAKTMLGISEGRMTFEQAQDQWTNNTGRMVYRSISGVPFMGVWSSMGLSIGESMYDMVTGTKGARKTNFGGTPMSSMFDQMARGIAHTTNAMLDGDKDIDMNKAAPVLNLIPGWGAWWFQAGLTGSGLNPRTPKD